MCVREWQCVCACVCVSDVSELVDERRERVLACVRVVKSQTSPVVCKN